MQIGIAADHGGFESKVQLTAALKTAVYEVEDFGAHELVAGDALSWDLVQTFLIAHFKESERFRRRLAKVEVVEREKTS